MNYRITQEFKPPFRINTLIEEAGSLKVDTIYFPFEKLKFVVAKCGLSNCLHVCCVKEQSDSTHFL